MQYLCSSFAFFCFNFNVERSLQKRKSWLLLLKDKEIFMRQEYIQLFKKR